MRKLNLQQGSEEWADARAGVITGTSLKQALGKTSKDFIYELIAENIAPTPENYVSEAMERGSDTESEAIQAYEAHTGILTEEVGFCLHSEYDWLGLSPDRLIKENGKYVKGVEVKCPATKTQVKYLIEKGIPSEYRCQVLQYFIVCEDLQELDFVTYDPRITIQDLRLNIVTVTREELADELEITMADLLKFRDKWQTLETNLIF